MNLLPPTSGIYLAYQSSATYIKCPVIVAGLELLEGLLHRPIGGVHSDCMVLN